MKAVQSPSAVSASIWAAETLFPPQSALVRDTIPLSLTTRESTFPMLRAFVALLLILWLLGFSFHVLGGLIHSLIIVAIIVFVIDLVKRD